jgi:hypothetical protein
MGLGLKVAFVPIAIGILSLRYENNRHKKTHLCEVGLKVAFVPIAIGILSLRYENNRHKKNPPL